MDLLGFFITNAQAADVAAAATTPSASSNLSLVLMLGIFIVFMYFTVLRPQAKRAKEQRNLLNSLAKGDEVLTTGGILGKIAKITDNYIVLSLAENIEITVQKSAVAGALPKGTLKSI